MWLEALIPISIRLAISRGFFRVLIVRGAAGFRGPASLRFFPPACATAELLVPTTTSTFNVLLAVLFLIFGIVY
jgi:hypothetical protein